MHKDLKGSLEKHIGRYCWKKNVKITDIEDNLKVCALYVRRGRFRMIRGLGVWIRRIVGCCSSRRKG